MTLQRIFDKIVNHLRKQGQQCEKNNQCQYRMETRKKVLKCAAGCLIPKADYDPAMEGQAISMYGGNLASEYFRKKFGNSPIGERKFRLVKDLQGVHDRSGNFKDGCLEDKFKLVAIDFGLTYTAPTV